MAYSRPGVTVTQKQKTQSFPLPEPTLKSCVIGPGYFYLDPDSEEATYGTNYTGSELVLSGENFSDYRDYVDNTVSVELYKVSGSDKNQRTQLIKDTDFTVSGEDIIISADLAGFTDTADKASVRVSYLSYRTDLEDSFKLVTSKDDIESEIGAPYTFNPLAYAAKLAMDNSGRATNILGVAPNAGGEDFTNAKEELELHEVYALAPLTSSQGSVFKAHVEQMSLPQNKKERIVFTSTKYDGYTANAGKSEKLVSAQELQNTASLIGSKRFFAIHPDGSWISERRHLSTLGVDFLQAIYGDSFDLLPKFSRPIDVVVGNTTYSYKRGDTITAEALQNLKDSKNDTYAIMEVLAPVPGYFFAAALAGQVAGKAPQTPLTKRGLVGDFSELYRSNNYFSEDALDIIAEGGNWILVDKGSGAIENRHQLSTDTTTIEARELSITNQLDFAAKFLRELAEPLVGKFVINDTFITNFKAAVIGGADTLVERGFIRALDILEVVQDDVEPDNVKADVKATVLYPVNKIKYTIIF